MKRLVVAIFITLSSICSSANAGNSILPLNVLGINLPILKYPWVDVREYGAKGDGVTNDNTAFARSIAAAQGGVLVIPEPPVEYLVNGNFTLTNNIVIMGMGQRPKISNQSSTATFIIDPSANQKNISIENLQIDGGTIAIDFNSSSPPKYLGRNSNFSNLYLTNQSNIGIRMLDTGIIDITFNKIEIESATNYGVFAQFDASTVAGINQCVWDKLRITGTGAWAFYVESTHATAGFSMSLRSPTFENNNGGALYVKRGVVRLDEPWIEKNGATAGAPDIELNGLTTAERSEVFITGGRIITPHANQSNRRVLFSGDGNIRFTAIGLYVSSGQTIDADNVVTATKIEEYSPASSFFTINNYPGGASRHY